MAISEALLPEFDHEMANTRKSLERVPDDKFDWKPHAKSPTMGWLAGHLAMIPHWGQVTAEQDSFDVEPKGGEPVRFETPKTRAAVLEMFDRNVSAARAAIASMKDDRWMQSWSLLKGGATMFAMPKVAVMRSFVMSHMIHHRAQLGVYLRLNDIPVPALYGPSADEGSM
jgi:uncharacterized damage-inducible protein DinB